MQKESDYPCLVAKGLPDEETECSRAEGCGFDQRSGLAISAVWNQRLGDGGPDFPQMEPTDQLDAANRSVPESRVGRFAKAARDHGTGLNLTISGPFFIGSLVGVGCRLMVLGPGLGTLELMPVWPSGHTLCYGAQRIFVVLRVPRAVCRGSAIGLPEDDPPEPEGHDPLSPFR